MSAFQIHRVVGDEEIPRTSDRHFLVREAAGSRGGGRAEDESGRPWKKQAVDSSEPEDLGVAGKKAAERLVAAAAAAVANPALPSTAAAITAAAEHTASSVPGAATSEAECLIAAAAAAVNLEPNDPSPQLAEQLRRHSQRAVSGVTAAAAGADQEGVVAGVYDSDAAENPLRCEARAPQRDTRHNMCRLLTTVCRAQLRHRKRWRA